MTPQELVELLKESVYLEVNIDREAFSDDYYVSVSLKAIETNELIAKSRTDLPKL